MKLACCAFLLLFVPALPAQSTPEVAPGVMLPATGTVTLLDTIDGHPATVTVHAREIKSNAHGGGNFARGMVLSGARSTAELDGVTSALAVHGSSPVFYVRLPQEDPDIARSRVTLIRLTPTKDARTAVEFSVNAFGGGRKRHVDEVATMKSDVDGGLWIKLVPQAPLAPGEYGIVFLPQDPMLFSAAVYDFSVHAPK